MRSTESVRPEALADVPGDAEYNLTRAVVVYRQKHLYWEQEGQALNDIGLGLVLDGSFPLAAEVVDLGSGRVHTLDLSVQVVVLDWVTEKTVAHAQQLRARDAARERLWSGPGQLLPYCDTLLVEVLRRAGFNPLTRPVLMRLGFRDLVRDLDLNEEPVIRVKLASGSWLTVGLDAENAALELRGAEGAERRDVHRELCEVFYDALVDAPDASADTLAVRFPVAQRLSDVHLMLESITRAVMYLYGQHEPQRFQQLTELLSIVGRRDSLGRLGILAVEEREPLAMAS